MAYQSTSALPPLVQQAQALSEDLRFESSSALEVGRLLHVLVSHIRAGRIGEIGTGCGVGAAWMIHALAPGVSFVTIERDSRRAAAVQALFADIPHVQVLQGDWRNLLVYAPFDLLFADGGRAKQEEPERLLAALRPGGLLVLDDLTPEDCWPEEWQSWTDPVRNFWLNDPRVRATEIRVTSSSAVILATRRSL
jgi:predicted O-methyltransferase YrrM